MCYNPEEAAKDRQEREHIVQTIQDQLTNGGLKRLLSVLAYLLEQVLEQQLREAGVEVTARQAMEDLATLRATDVTMAGPPVPTHFS